MKNALMITAMVLASVGAAAAGTSQSNSPDGMQQNKHHASGAATNATKSMNRGTSANGGMGTGGVTTGSGASRNNDSPANTSMDRSGRAGTSASPGTGTAPNSR